MWSLCLIGIALGIAAGPVSHEKCLLVLNWVNISVFPLILGRNGQKLVSLQHDQWSLEIPWSHFWYTFPFIFSFYLYLNNWNPCPSMPLKIHSLPCLVFNPFKMSVTSLADLCKIFRSSKCHTTIIWQSCITQLPCLDNKDWWQIPLNANHPTTSDRRGVNSVKEHRMPLPT